MLTALEIGEVDLDGPVETARAGECGVQKLFSVGGGEHYNVGLCVEAVHLNEELVEGGVAFIISSELSI